MRIIVYTGKGGVGKTSVAAATAVRLAAGGSRTLVMSTDAAHSLADSLDQPVGPDPTPVTANLWGQEVDSLQEMERSWGSVQRWLTGVLQWAKVGDISAEELVVFPGLEELFSLLQIHRQARSGNFDAIVVDCAPTGETLRLLSFPDAFQWWIHRIFPMERKLVRVARPVARVMGKGLELPGEDVFDTVEDLFAQLEELQVLLQDPRVTSVRIVLNPEKMVISEARRSFTYLNLYGFNTDAVVVNRVLPESVDTGYLANWRRIQGKYEEEIQQSFAPLPVLRVPLMETEVVGLPMLDRVADAAFAATDPGAILHVGQVERVQREGEGYVLEVAAPFAAREEINLTQRGDELTIQVGRYKHKVLLPRTLMGRPVLGARFAGQKLRVRFGERPSAGTEATVEEV